MYQYLQWLGNGCAHYRLTRVCVNLGVLITRGRPENKQTNKRTRSPVAKTAIIHVQVISCHGGSAPSWLHICILKQPSKVYTHVLTPPRSVQTKYAVTAFLRKQLFRQNCNHIHYYTGIPQNKQPTPSQLHTCTISSVRTVYIITPPLPIEATFSVTTTHNYELRPFQFR